jgi:4-hydroxy-tetrahydrodipicolinate reductase
MKKPKIMVNGLPGKMSKIIAEGILTEGKYDLVTTSLTGGGMPSEINIAGEIIYLVKPTNHDITLRDIKNHRHYENVIAIDFSKGKGVADRNAKMYFDAKIPFIMGATGVENDLEKLATVPCVEAPNMDAQIVSLMDGIKYMAENYPGAWKDYSIHLAETHQKDKSDTSGTMKKMIKHLSALTLKEISVEDILKTRDEKTQRAMWQVPDQWIGWHAYHIFDARSPVEGGENRLLIKLERLGGECYRQGVMKALDWMVQEKYKKAHNTMFDVLRKK